MITQLFRYIVHFGQIMFIGSAFFKSHDLVSFALIHRISLSDEEISTWVNFLNGIMIFIFSIFHLGHLIVNFSFVKYSHG
jgi:hypothetical protein